MLIELHHNSGGAAIPFSMIGIFDSGIGGMSVMQAVVQLLPKENIVYVADSANCPYGNRSLKDIQHLSHRIVAMLTDIGCEVVVAACNTVTTAAIEYLRREYNRTAFVGMEPAIKPAIAQSPSKRIAVLATQRTLEGEKFRATLQQHAQDADVHIIVGNGLVELVEQGMEDSEEAIDTLRLLLQPTLDAGIDTIVLGCTHYPFLRKAIHAITGNDVQLVDAAIPVAQQTKRLLELQHGHATVEHEAQYIFYTSGNIEVLRWMQEKHLQLKNVEYKLL